MTQERALREVQLIPTEQIVVVNPRTRNKKIFREITENIGEIGLKRPITVALRAGLSGPRYELVCGQGRLEAYQSLGQQEIPAFVIEADTEECLVMSLVENLARRQHRPIELLHDIAGLRARGYNDDDIAQKTGLTAGYVRDVIHLIESGEHRLLRAVEAHQIPVSVAVSIAKADDADVKQVLQQAYENKSLRGRKLLAVKRLVEQRRSHGKGRKAVPGSRKQPLSVDRLMRTYRDDTDKKKRLVRKAEKTRDCLIFLVEGFRKLLADQHFVTLLRAEGIDTLPRNLGQRLGGSQ